MLFAALMSVLANIWRDPDKHSKPFEPEEFMPKFVAGDDEDEDTSVELPSAQDLYDKLRTWALLSGAKSKGTTDGNNRIPASKTGP